MEKRAGNSGPPLQPPRGIWAATALSLFLGTPTGLPINEESFHDVLEEVMA